MSLLLFLWACQIAVHADTWVDTSGHNVSFVTAAPGVTVEVLDWGGSGPPIFLLAGLNNTAHIFDHFAHQFTGRFRVFGITRRGFGASARPSTGYDSRTLAHDILAVADKMKVERVVLVGHSIAGDEMTTFAALFPARVSALVYLDAAYDRTKSPAPTPAPDQPVTDQDTASVERLEARFARVFGWRLPEGEVRAQIVVDSDGRILRSTGSPDVAAQVLKGVERPAYDKIRCPALAIYALDQISSLYPNFETFDAENRVRAERQVADLRPWQDTSIGQFRQEVANGKIAVLGASNHYLFLTNESEVVRLIWAFLSEALRR